MVVEVSEVLEVIKVSEVVKNNLYAAITKSADRYAGSMNNRRPLLPKPKSGQP